MDLSLLHFCTSVTPSFVPPAHYEGVLLGGTLHGGST
jgi:hypothetical protein